ncbi:hypothetical protein [Streptomyces spirodelae]|nr:hypothetical protein [Streptomyces spirodelae]
MPTMPPRVATQVDRPAVRREFGAPVRRAAGVAPRRAEEVA